MHRFASLGLLACLYAAGCSGRPGTERAGEKEESPEDRAAAALRKLDIQVIRDKKAELATVKPEPAGTQYEPTDYKVTFLSDDVAIMTHGTKGKDAHRSLHVWSHKTGQWKVVATSSTPVKSE